MANNIGVADKDGAAVTLKSTDNAGVHTPHQNVDTLPATTFGALNDAAVDDDSAGTALAFLRGLNKNFAAYLARFPAALGQDDMAGSTPVVIASDQTAVKTTPQATENHIGQVGGHTALVEVVLSLDESQYADGDVLAQTQAVLSAFRVSNGTGVLQSVVVNDKDDQGEALDLVFLKSNVSIGTENAAVSIADSDADEILGIVSVAAEDFVDLGGCRVATLTGLALPVKSATGTSAFYLAAISRGTGTYTASGITLKLGIIQD